jgi:hypothetical protein
MATTWRMAISGKAARRGNEPHRGGTTGQSEADQAQPTLWWGPEVVQPAAVQPTGSALTC